MLKGTKEIKTSFVPFMIKNTLVWLLFYEFY